MFYNAGVHQSPPMELLFSRRHVSLGGKNREFFFSFDKLLSLVREMEIINGIKFHAIISFDFFSHFCSVVY
jgi:hypothetical protein